MSKLNHCRVAFRCLTCALISMAAWGNPLTLAETSCEPFCAIPVSREALDHVDVRVGQSRVRQADLEIKRLQSSFGPDISNTASLSFERMSKNDRFPIFNDNPYERFLLGSSVSYDPDLFEKRADKVQRSSLLREKAEVDLASIRNELYFQSLIAYTEAVQAKHEGFLLERAISHARQRLEIIEKQVSLGLEMESAVLDAQEELNDLIGRLRSASSKKALEARLLTHLYGLEVETTHADPVWLVPDFSPKDLLRHPPLSIRKPILDLEVAFVERLIHEKTALPDIYLGAEVSLASLLLGSLINPASIAWQIGPRLQYVKRPDHDLVRALHKERIHEAILLTEGAWKELSFNLDRSRLRIQQLMSSIDREQDALSTMVKRSAISRLRFETGSSDMANHLRNLIAEDLQSILLSRQRTQLTIEVIRTHQLIL